MLSVWSTNGSILIVKQRSSSQSLWFYSEQSTKPSHNKTETMVSSTEKTVIVVILVLFFPGLLDLKDKKYIHEIVVCGFIYGLITSTHHVALLVTPMPALIGALLPAIGCAIGSELVVACFLPVILRPSIIVVLGGHLLEE